MPASNLRPTTTGRSRLLAALLCVLPLAALHADRGTIMLSPRPTGLVEPNQRALLAWSSRTGEQLTILGTTLKAQEPTWVFEVMPFPSQPRFEAGRIDVIRNCRRFVQQVIDQFRRPTMRGPIRGAPELNARGLTRRAPAVQVAEAKAIGNHAVFSLRVTRPEAVSDPEALVREFAAAIRGRLGDPAFQATLGADRFRALGELAATELLEGGIRRIAYTLVEYVSEGYDWFALDATEIGTTLAEYDAIQYTFRSEHLFYPMRISREDQGETEVELFVLSDIAFQKEHFHGLEREVRLKQGCPLGQPVPQFRDCLLATDFRLDQTTFDGLFADASGRPFPVSGSDPAPLSEWVHRLLGRPIDMMLRAWEIRGDISSFSQDLIVGPKPYRPVRRAEVAPLDASGIVPVRPVSFTGDGFLGIDSGSDSSIDL